MKHTLILMSIAWILTASSVESKVQAPSLGSNGLKSAQGGERQPLEDPERKPCCPSDNYPVDPDVLPDRPRPIRDCQPPGTGEGTSGGRTGPGSGRGQASAGAGTGSGGGSSSFSSHGSEEPKMEEEFEPVFEEAQFRLSIALSRLKLALSRRALSWAEAEIRLDLMRQALESLELRLEAKVELLVRLETSKAILGSWASSGEARRKELDS